MKKEHPPNSPVGNREIVKVDTTARNAIRIMPMEDYQLFIIDTKEAEITIRPKTLEMRNFLMQATPGSIMQVLRQLDSDMDEYLPNTITGILSEVHTRPDVPELHSICMSDIARRSVSFYSRLNEDSDECQWVVHPQESSIQVLTQHARDLFSCLLEIGLAGLVIQVWKDEEIVLTMTKGERILMVQYEDDFDQIRVRTNKFDPKYLTACPESRSSEAAVLLKIIEDRKTHVLKMVKHRVMPKRKQIDFFLNQGRPVCYPTFNGNRVS